MKPMLAGKATDIEKLNFPVLVSPKLDGIRALVVDGVVVSRNLKPIPNTYVQRCFSHLEGYDGELIVGDPTSPSAFRDTTSGVMSVDGFPDVKFYVFDMWNTPSLSYLCRYSSIAYETHVIKVPHHHVTTSEQITVLEKRYLDLGYEGVMIRGPKSPYKYGRSTEREGWLLKLKRFDDSEAYVIGMEEKVHNGNEATINALGHMERSSHLENRVPLNVMGALIVRDIKTGTQFNIGTGFDDSEREIWWKYEGYHVSFASDGSQIRTWPDPIATVKYKYFATGSKDKPRFPTYLGERKE